MIDSDIVEYLVNRFRAIAFLFVRALFNLHIWELVNFLLPLLHNIYSNSIRLKIRIALECLIIPLCFFYDKEHYSMTSPFGVLQKIMLLHRFTVSITLLGWMMLYHELEESMFFLHYCQKIMQKSYMHFGNSGQ